MYATCHNMAAAAALLHMGNCHESSSERDPVHRSYFI